jgi:integrase
MWSDVNLDTGNVSVRRARVPVAGRVIEGTPKSDRARVIALAPQVVAALRRHRTGQLEERFACAEAWQDTGYVFTSEDGSPLRPDWLTAQFDELARAAALPRIRFHDLRHSFATLALAANVHPKVVQDILGHANVGITLDLYSHVVPGMQADATAKIAGLLSL